MEPQLVERLEPGADEGVARREAGLNTAGHVRVRPRLHALHERDRLPVDRLAVNERELIARRGPRDLAVLGLDVDDDAVGDRPRQLPRPADVGAGDPPLAAKPHLLWTESNRLAGLDARVGLDVRDLVHVREASAGANAPAVFRPQSKPTAVGSFSSRTSAPESPWSQKIESAKISA
jgi:hypothetical protein